MTTFPIIALGDGDVSDGAWFADITAAVNDHETRLSAAEATIATSSVSITDATSRTTTSTTFTSTLSPANVLGISFVVPTSGKILVTWSAGMSNGSSPNIAQMGWQVKTGSVVDSGTLVAALAADAARTTLSITGVRASGTFFVNSGTLTPGATYNITAYHRAFSTGTATFDNRELSVIPLIA